MRGFNWLEYAEVAELVDAHDSGSCTRKSVEVRVFSSAPIISRVLDGIVSKIQKNRGFRLYSI